MIFDLTSSVKFIKTLNKERVRKLSFYLITYHIITLKTCLALEIRFKLHSLHRRYQSNNTVHQSINNPDHIILKSNSPNRVIVIIYKETFLSPSCHCSIITSFCTTHISHNCTLCARTWDISVVIALLIC